MRPLQTTAVETDTAAASCIPVEMTFGSHQQTSGKYLVMRLQGDGTFCA
jgi:hypothetical protein